MRLIGQAPATVRAFTEAELLAAHARVGLEIVVVERHGTKSKDPRAFIVARRPER